MNPITSFIKRYPQATFWVLAWSTWFLGWILEAMFPSDIWALFIYSPFLVGVLVTAIVDGRNGLKTFFSRIVRWRVGLKWYAVALLTPVVLYLVAAGLNVLSGATIVTNIQWPAWSGFIAEILIISFFMIALGEEPGFRGFALPRLLVNRPAIAAGLILGVLHAIWHVPTFLGGNVITILSTILIIIGGAVLNTWLFNHTNGSVFMAMLLHVSIDTVSGDRGLLKLLFSGTDLERQVVWLALAYVGMAILLVVLTGKELGRQPETPVDLAAAERPVIAK
ncbi:MAG TPA: CPBP family intramembrane metalloprotease [Chloroflexota bacterium]|nr:CPBP family intramembrane metalloprotease [Chloroflexota bacterium]HUM68222.1 CPBP family intramembrane metalloprotease [Chloroflexota bacterium]